MPAALVKKLNVIKMKILFCGDVVGSVGRKVVLDNIDKIKVEHQIDFTIINCDNASGGFGINKNAYNQFAGAGVDVVTGGDHIWDQREVVSFISESKKLLRPANFPKSAPGIGERIFVTADGRKVLVIHLLGQVFIKYHVGCPFEEVERIVKKHQLKKDVDAIFVDFHAEATSEKMAMGKFLDGKVSAVVGTHTHIPTADCHVMKGGTAYQTDAGMCGDYDSIIGMDKLVPLQMFIHKRKFDKMTPAQGEATLCAAVVEINDITGLADKIYSIKLGGIIGN